VRHSRVADCQDSLRRPPRRPLAFARPRAGRTNTLGATQHRRRPRPDRSNERRRAFAAAAHAIIRWRLPLYAWPERSMRQPDARHSLSAQTVARTPRPAPLLRESHRTPGSPRTNRTAPLASSFAAAGQLLQDRIRLYPTVVGASVRADRRMRFAPGVSVDFAYDRPLSTGSIRRPRVSARPTKTRSGRRAPLAPRRCAWRSEGLTHSRRDGRGSSPTFFPQISSPARLLLPRLFPPTDLLPLLA